MTKQDIIRKLTSRKLWVAVCEFIAMLWVALGHTETEAATIVALVMAGAGAIAYIIGEGLTDAAGTIVVGEPVEIVEAEQETE